MSHDLTFLLLAVLSLVHADGDVVVCGGFIKSSVKIPFSAVKVGVFSPDGILKESTECAPHNGYFLLPLYAKGQISVKVLPPDGWTFEPSEMLLNIDGSSDKCTKGEDLNFVFKGFTVSGSILSKGLDVGPSGVSTMLIKSDGTQQHTTSVDGSFSISQVLSGTYTVSFSHPDWKLENPSLEITVEQDNYQIAESFRVVSYNAQGLVQSSGQPIAGVEVYLTSLNPDNGAVEGCQSVDSPWGTCKVVSGTDGVFHFPALSPGQYKIVPHYQSEHSTFDVSPNQLVFTVDRDTVVLKDTFTVNGFAVLGKVLDSDGGSPLGGVAIFVNGEKVASTNTDGMFELSNVTSGNYEVEAKMKGYYFATQTLSISPTNPTLPELFANAYQLCGHVAMDHPPKSALPLGQRKVGLQPADEGSNVAMVTTVTDVSGAFCFKVSPGKYTVQNLIGNNERREGLRISPENVQVEVTNKPHHGTEFKQKLASVEGSIKCINSPCEAFPVHLEASDGTKTSVTVENDVWKFKDILPGNYKVSVDYPRWCWIESKYTVNIDIDTDSAMPIFEQSGYIMKVQVSHAAQLNFSQSGDENIGTFSLEPDTNRFCLKKPGLYELIPYACHKFEHDTYTYDTGNPDEVVLNAVQHLVSGEILTKNTEALVQVALTNMDTYEKILLDAKVTDETTDEGFTLLTYQMWSKPHQKYVVKPVSENLLFTPTTHTVQVSDKECPSVVPKFYGHLGTFISGKITPPVRGVLVTLTSPDNLDLKLTQITDDKGEYSIGPLHNHLKYKVSAHKQDYDIHETTEKGHDFSAVKLSKLTVNVKDDEGTLPGVLVSVSGTNGYRNNVKLDHKPLVLTGLVPGEYFIRPILKEYMFSPSSKMMTVSEGLEVSLELVARRTSYSCYGVITTLNGKPQPDVVVEAIGAGKCALQEEGVTDSEGVYRIRGLPPNCPITVSVRTDKSDNIQRASPASKVVQTGVVDSKDVNFVVFYKSTTFDITGYVDINEDFVPSTKVLLIEETGAGRVLHTAILDSSRIFIFPEMSLASKFTLKLESSLSSSMYSYKIPEAKVKSEGPFQHVELTLSPVRKTVHQEQVTRASFTALAVIVLSMVLAANHATLVPVFTQVFQSVVNRNNNEVQPTGETNGMEYVDDIHRGIRRKATKKR